MIASRALFPAVLLGVVLAFVLGHWMGHRQQSGDLIVVLDGGAERLARADQFRQQFDFKHPQQLLIRCPRTPPLPQAIQELLQGYDTVTQITALADWLRRRQAQPPQRIWIATDPEHTARATLLSRIALAGRGIQIQPEPPPPPSPGGWLVPQTIACKRSQCGL